MAPTMNSSTLRGMAVHSAGVMHKLADLWLAKSELMEWGFFCVREDCNVSPIYIGDPMQANDSAPVLTQRWSQSMVYVRRLPRNARQPR